MSNITGAVIISQTANLQVSPKSIVHGGYLVQEWQWDSPRYIAVYLSCIFTSGLFLAYPCIVSETAYIIMIMIMIRVGSWWCGWLVTWFCYQLIAKPGNKTAALPWPEHLYFALHFTPFPGNMVEVGAALLLRYLKHDDVEGWGLNYGQVS